MDELSLYQHNEVTSGNLQSFLQRRVLENKLGTSTKEGYVKCYKDYLARNKKTSLSTYDFNKWASSILPNEPKSVRGSLTPGDAQTVLGIIKKFK